MAMAGPLSANMGALMAPRAMTSMRSCFFRPICTATQTRRRGYTGDAYRYAAIETPPQKGKQGSSNISHAVAAAVV